MTSRDQAFERPGDLGVNAVNLLEAKTNLSRLVDAIERGAEREIVIARYGELVIAV